MKAVVIHEHGGLEQLRWEDVPDPRPTRHQVVIRVAAVGVNQLDLFVRKGMPGLRVPLPMITGADIAGEVADPNGHEGWRAGDRVSVFPLVETSGWAGGLSTLGEILPGGRCELMAVDASRLIRLPETVSFEQAAALPCAYATALRMLDRGRVVAGERMLVVGAAGGVGTACVQLGLLRGAEVIACATGAAKTSWLKQHGATWTVDYAVSPLRAACREMFGSHALDVAVNFTGGDTWAETLGTLRRDGRQLTCGATAGFSPPTDLRQIFAYELHVIGSNGFSFADQERVIGLVASGALKPAISQVLPLRQARDAEALLERRELLGKVVLTP